MSIYKSFFRKFFFYKIFNWNNPQIRSVIYQGLFLFFLIWVVSLLISNVLRNFSLRNIVTGFDFITHEAGFSIGDSIIKYFPTDSYLRAILVGLSNTLRIASIGIVLATLLGFFLGIGRLSKNRLFFTLSSTYVEIVRNIPLLLQVFFWYSLIIESFPNPSRAINPIPGVFISNRGIRIPSLGDGLTNCFLEISLFALFSILITRFWISRCEKIYARGILFSGTIIGVLIFIGSILIYFFNGFPSEIDIPVMNRFNFQGGSNLSPEFLALLISLVFYSSAFIAEVIRSGIQAVEFCQWEAGYSIGLNKKQIFRLVIFPQALRIFIPPMISQYLNLTKNSSLAIVIGYPDIVSIINTIINQTGQAIEGVLLILSTYLGINLSISILMNLYNKYVVMNADIR